MKSELSYFAKIALFGVTGLFTLQACNGGGDDDAPANIDYSIIEYINEPYQPFEPQLGAAVPKTSAKDLIAASLPYPPFNPHDLKTIGPEGWGDREQLADTGMGGVKFNLIWSQWQPDPNLSPNDPNTFTYDGKTWLISSSREKQIRWYSERGIKVTAVIYGTPEWARKENTAKIGNVPLVDHRFIAPDNPEDFARFAGMLAKRFNGANGNGRIVNFVVQNEVNALDWYNPGCGAATAPCDINDRIDSYAKLFNLTYDRIVAEQEHARVMLSFDHHFGLAFADNERFTSAQRFIEALDPKLGDRQWRIAFHSYPPNLFHPEFGPYDYPKITFGNLGILASYLRKTFPNRPYTWEIHLTENGINSGSPSSEDLMDQQLKVATRNVLGTPGIETFYYHRLIDHSDEGSFTPGLFNSNKKSKKAWTTYSSNNLYYSNPPRLDDGYELLPYVRLERSVHPQIGHWASTRQAPAGYTTEASYLLLREPADNTKLLYECHVDAIRVTYISDKLNCQDNTNYGPVGYIFVQNNNQGTRSPLYTIKLGDSDYITSTRPQEANGTATLLGYVDTVQARKQAIPERDLSYFNTNKSNKSPLIESDSTTPAQNTPTETSLETCITDDDGKPCAYLQFTTQSGQFHQLSCETRPKQNEIAMALSYGNQEVSTIENLINHGTRTTDSYDIPLIVPDDATWASISITNENDESTFIPQCSIVTSGGLQIGAASDKSPENLLYNSDFEAEITDWKFCEGNSTDYITDDASSGERAITIGDGNCVYQEINITAGETYQMVCLARNQTDDTQKASLRFALASNSYQTLIDENQSISSDTYEEYSATLTAPEHSIYAVVSFQSDGSASIDGCSVVQLPQDQ